jgi:hypothetical protein
MILQLGGLGTVCDAVRTAASDSVDPEGKNGKFDFWYQ